MTKPVLARLFGAFTLASALLLPAAPAAAEPGVSADTIKLAQTSTLSGPLGDLGKEILKGSRAYFDALNASGGVHGRKIELTVVDDAYDKAKTVAFVKEFIAAQDSFALFNPLGTPNNMALLPLTQADGMPVVAPFTGALAVRDPKAAAVFNIRASYADETTKLVEHLTTIGIRRIAMAYQNNAFGKEALDAAVAALAERKLELVAQASVENDASDAVASARTLVAASPEAVLLGLAGKPTIEVIRYIAQNKRGTALYALSVLATAGNLKLLGPDGVGVAISQVMPFPTSATSPLAREYREAMLKAGHKDFTHLSLEGYVNAKVMAEGLRRAGRDLTRKGFVAAMHGLRRHDLGGMEVSFGQGGRSGSKLVDLTMIDSRGQLIR